MNGLLIPLQESDYIDVVTNKMTEFRCFRILLHFIDIHNKQPSKIHPRTWPILRHLILNVAQDDKSLNVVGK